MEEAIKDDMETTNDLRRYGYFQNLGGPFSYTHPFMQAPITFSNSVSQPKQREWEKLLAGSIRSGA